MENNMKKILAAAVVVGLLVLPALALDPKVATAVKAFEAVAADAAKLKTYCDMSKTMGEADETDAENTDLDKKIQGFMDTLGPDVVAAFDAGEDLDPDSADGKAYDAAIEKLDGMCS